MDVTKFLSQFVYVILMIWFILSSIFMMLGLYLSWGGSDRRGDAANAALVAVVFFLSSAIMTLFVLLTLQIL